MGILRRGSSRGLLAAAAACGLTGLVGCQAEYGGMNLPSMRYLYDDVQYFEPGPHFRWANTQAATQRARMEAMGINPDEPVAQGAGATVPPPPVPAGPGGMAVDPGGAGLGPAPGGAPGRVDPGGAGLNEPAVNEVPGGNVPAPPAPGPDGPGPDGNGGF